ncbi:zinc finger protein 219-like [Amphibalanus amphitrite]|uniref:zinc finger protein 219-like n=1 Tax=Amphibalanus amphitrite TaxID=1232801 RepID=UPI001C9103EA|nr:zinc finger protein 219-like [Amphibalanus amphitrite]
MAAAMSGVSLMEAISARLRRTDVTLERADSGAEVIKLERADSSDGALSLTAGGPAELRWHNAPIATYVAEQRLFRCGQCAVTAFLARPMAEHWLGAHADFKAFQCPHCPYMSSWQRCVRMHLVRHHGDRVSEVAEFSNSHVMADILERLSELKRDSELRAPPSPADDEPIVEELVIDDGAGGKRHHCPHCPYSTHRRDLFNRHENIHKSDKPFQCYICQRMFNRADHVKKHFLRIHRDEPYDVTRIRRIPPKTLTAQVYYSRAASLTSDSQPPRSPEKPVAVAPSPPALPPPPPPPPRSNPSARRRQAAGAEPEPACRRAPLGRVAARQSGAHQTGRLAVRRTEGEPTPAARRLDTQRV